MPFSTASSHGSRSKSSGTMGMPGSLSARDAESVAGHVHDTFYSKFARERNRPARVELARLTVDEMIGAYYRQVAVVWDGGAVLAPTPP